MDTAMAETKLEEEIKWRNKLDLYQKTHVKALAAAKARQDGGVQAVVQDVGNAFQDQFELQVSQLSTEKEEHARLASGTL